MYFYMLIEQMSTVNSGLSIPVNEVKRMTIKDMQKGLHHKKKLFVINVIKSWDKSQNDVIAIVTIIVRNVLGTVKDDERYTEAKSYAEVIIDAIDGFNAKKFDMNTIRKELVFHLIRDMHQVVRRDADANNDFQGEQHRFRGHYRQAIESCLGIDAQQFSEQIRKQLTYIGDSTNYIRKARSFKRLYKVLVVMGTETALKLIEVKDKHLMSPSQVEETKRQLLNGLASLVENESSDTPFRFEEKVELSVTYDRFTEKRYSEAEQKWKAFIKTRLYDRIGADIENALNIELDVGPFDYTHLFDNEKLKLRPAGETMHADEPHSIRERSERIDAILRALPILLKLPDAFCYLNEGKLLNHHPHHHPVYGPIYQRSMDKLFVDYGLGSRGDYRAELNE